MKTILHPGDRVIAKTNQQGLQRGRTYQVKAAKIEIPECVRKVVEIPSYVLSTWPERQAHEITVRCGIVHLRLATGWSLL